MSYKIDEEELKSPSAAPENHMNEHGSSSDSSVVLSDTDGDEGGVLLMVSLLHNKRRQLKILQNGRGSRTQSSQIN